MQLLKSLLGLSGMCRSRSGLRGDDAYLVCQQLISILSAIFDDTKDQIKEPIVQCVQIKPLPSQPGIDERYRAVFSDIANYVQTMLASRMWLRPHGMQRFANYSRRGESCGNEWDLAKRVLCQTQAIPGKCCQG